MDENRRLERSDGPWLASLLLVGCLIVASFALIAQHITAGQGGVPLDDAWIHFQFARNLARGDGLSFNPQQPTSGSTAPLWTLLLAGAYRAGARFPAAGQVLSALSYLGMLGATYALGKRVTGRRWTAWLAGMLVAVNGRLAWAGLSALEICLFAVLSLAAMAMHLADRKTGRYRLGTAALFGLAALSRPEGYLLFALSAASFAGHALRQAKPRSVKDGLRAVSTLLPGLALFVAIIAPYLAFSWRTSGRLLPNTYHAKAAISLLPDRAFRDFLSVGAVYLILDNGLMLPFFLLGLMLLVPRAPLLSLWAVGLPLAYAVIRASLYQHGRYLMPLIPLNAVIAVWGLGEFWALARRRGWRRGRIPPRTWGVIACTLALMGTAWRLPTMARQYAWNVQNINHMHVALGHWVAENAPPDAVLALNDIGAIAYVSQRPVVDLAGLVTPQITPAMRAPGQTAQLIDFLARREVAYVIIFPNWFPELAASDALQEVHRVTLEKRTITGGETMVVYEFRLP